MATNDVTIRIGAETQQAIASISNLTKTIVGVGGLLYGLNKIKDMFMDIGEAASRQQAAFNKLYISLQGNIQATKDFAKFADEMQDSLNISNDELMKAIANFNMLAGLTERELEQLTPRVIDFANAFGMDLNAAFLLVGKTLSSSTNALTRYGIQIDMSKDKAGKLAEIVKQLSQFTGATAAETETFTGKLKHLANTIDDTKKVAGEFLDSSQFVSDFMLGLEGFVLFVQNEVAPAFAAVVEGSVFVVNSAVKVVSDLLGTIVRGWDEAIRFLVEKVKNVTDSLGMTPEWLNTLAESTTDIVNKANIFEKVSKNIDQTLQSIAKDLFLAQKHQDLIAKNAAFAEKHLANVAKHATKVKEETEETESIQTKQKADVEGIVSLEQEILKDSEVQKETTQTIWDTVSNIAKKYNVMAEAQQVMLNLWVGISSAIDFAKEHAFDLLNIARNLASGDILGTIRAGFEAAGGLIGEYIGGEAGSEAGSQIASVIFTGIETAIKKIFNNFNAIVPIRETWSAVWSMGSEEFYKNIEGWETALTTKLQNFLDNFPLLLDIWYKAAENFKTFWEENKAKLREEIRSFFYFVLPVMADIVRIVAPIVGEIMLTVLEEYVRGLMMFWYNEFENMIANVWEYFFGIGEMIADGIRSKAIEIGQEIGAAIAKPVESTKTGIEKTYGEIKAELGL